MGVGVARPPQDLVHGALLDDPARVHDRDPVCDLADHGQVVGDVQHRDLLLVPQAEQLGQDPVLGDHVKPGGRLVQHDHVRPGRQRHRDAHPLLLAAGQLVRIPPPEFRPRRQPDPVQQPRRARLAARLRLVGAEHVLDGGGDPERRVQRLARVLRHVGHQPAPGPAERLLAGQRLAGDLDVALGRPDPAFPVAEQGQRGRGLARTGLADQAEDLPGPQVQADVLDDRRPAGQLDPQAAGLQHGPVHPVLASTVLASTVPASTAAVRRGHGRPRDRPRRRT